MGNKRAIIDEKHNSHTTHQTNMHTKTKAIGYVLESEDTCFYHPTGGFGGDEMTRRRGNKRNKKETNFLSLTVDTRETEQTLPQFACARVTSSQQLW